MIDKVTMDSYYNMIMGMFIVSILTFIIGLFSGIIWYDNYIADIVRPTVYPKTVDYKAHKDIHTQELIETLIKEVNYARQTNNK